VAFFVEMNLQLGIIVSNDEEQWKPNATDQGELLHVRPSRECRMSGLKTHQDGSD
jgi:hypothetical protein